jgi:phosphate transport system substrate-binding protein
MSSKWWLVLAACGVLAFSVAACGDDDDDGGDGASGLSGTINIDGSSTVFPFTQRAAELFNEENPDVKINVGQSGTGGGFEKFCAGETDLSDASRPIEEEEIAICEKNGITYEELQVASDGIAVVTNPAVEVSCLSTEQLKQLWNAGSKVANLSELGNDPEGGQPLPDAQLSLYGPGTDSGTFDFFTEEINGEEGVSREDYQPSEDDNVLVQGVSGDEGGLGYFGFSYFEQNADQLNLVSVDGGDGCVAPSVETIQDESYFLSRPLFIYPSSEAIARPEVEAFVQYTLDNYEQIATDALIVPMPADAAAASKSTFDSLAGGGGGGTATTGGTETQ